MDDGGTSAIIHAGFFGNDNTTSAASGAGSYFFLILRSIPYVDYIPNQIFGIF